MSTPEGRVHRRHHRKTRDSRRDTWEQQNDNFVRDFLQFWDLVASKSTFSYEFSYEPQNLLSQNRCFVPGFHQFSAHLTKCHAYTEFAPCRHLTQCDLQKTRQTTRLKRCCQEKWRWTHSKCCACHENCNASSENVAKKYCACHTKPLSTRYKTRLNVTKCRACQAKRSNETFKTSKNDPFCRTYHRHGHIAIARTVADVNAASSEHTLSPQTPRGKREPLLRIRENDIKSSSHWC